MNNKYLLSISGGVDSTYLFYYLVNKKIDFDLIHINHNTRGIENSNELNFCKQLANKYNKEIYIYNFIFTSGNFQQEARNFRLTKIKECINKYNYDGVYYAHHKDDQIENILMHSNRVSNPLMKEKTNVNNIIIIRPLLNLYKSDIISYMKTNSLNYFEDSSNKNDKYQRNNIRNNIASNMSTLEKEELYCKTLELHKDDKIYCDIIKVKEIGTLQVLNNYLQFNNFYKNHNFVKMVYNSMSVDGNKEYKLDDKYNLYCNYGVLSIAKNVIISEPIKKVNVGINTFNDISFKVNVNNCYVRSFNKDDIFKHKKINRIFIDYKIPKQLRSVWPIIVNENDEIIKIILNEEII